MKFTLEQYTAMDADIAALNDSSDSSVNIIWENHATSKTSKNPAKGWDIDGMSWTQLAEYIKQKRGEA